MRYRSTADVRLFSFSSIVQPFQNVLNICVPEIPVMYPLSLFIGDLCTCFRKDSFYKSHTDMVINAVQFTNNML